MKQKLNPYYVESMHTNLQVQMVLETGSLNIVPNLWVCPTQNCLTNRFKLEDSLLNGSKQMYAQCLKKKTDLIKQITGQSHCLAAPQKF